MTIGRRAAVWAAMALLAAGSVPTAAAPMTDAVDEICLTADALLPDGGTVERTALDGREALLLSADAAVQAAFTVEQAGEYRIEIEYRPLESTIRDLGCRLLIDGALPCAQAADLHLPKRYVADAVRQDSRGNDLRPETTADRVWSTHTLAEDTGVSGEISLALTAGEHRLTLTALDEHFAVSAVRFYRPQAAPDYAVYRRLHGDTAPAGYAQTVEAESAAYRSSAVIALNTDRSGPQVSPNDPARLRVNTLGGSGWARYGQYAVWCVTVPHSGYYRLSVRYRQNSARGRKTYRRLTVNGSVPFAEAEALPFSFSDAWQTDDLFAGDIYLTAGENELRLEAVLGPYAAVVRAADETARRLGALYREIMMITGSDPDSSRDYMLADELPDLPEKLQALREDLSGIEQSLLSVDERSLTDDAAIVRTLLVQLDGFLRDTEQIPMRLSSFQTNISSFGDLVAGLKKQPLELDAFGIVSAGENSVLTVPSLAARLRYAAAAFAASFSGDYTSVGDVAEGGSTVELWINSSGTVGREQAEIIKQALDSRFTRDTGIGVDLKLVSQALAPAIFSGRGPDAALYVSAGEPVDLAARGGLQDLRGMEGFSQLAAGLTEDAFLPYTYNGGVYAVPFTEDLPVMFCRTDILQELGVEPPDTWDEFYRVLSVIQKNNMTVGIPNVRGTQMSIDTTVYAMLLYQRGGQYYSAAQDETAFDSEAAHDAFRQWTDLYKNYSLPVQYSFYQRFRLGDMPLGIEGCSMATLLESAAPEIDGLWAMAPLPGTRRSDGTVCRTAIASGACSVMLKSARDKAATWQVMRWLSGTQAQTAIGLGIESALGAAGRFMAADHTAFEALPWDRAQAAAIRTQRREVTFLPQVPGGYYVERGLTNAFRRTVFYGRNYREALTEYKREMDLEIARKRREFGLA